MSLVYRKTITTLMSIMPATIAIDGSTLEGGGQLVRNSISLAALLRQPISISNIRANRSSKGLKAQHVAGIKLVQEICSAKVTGLEKGSETIEFLPGPSVATGAFEADPGTAGSTTLLLQVSLPCLVFATSETCQYSTLKLRGGTNAIQAPQIDYTNTIFLPFLRNHFGISPILDIRKRGYWPKGGGEVHVAVPTFSRQDNKPLQAIQLLSRGKIIRISGRSWVAGLPKHVAKSMRDAARSYLMGFAESLGLNESMIDIPYIRETHEDAIGTGSGVFLYAETDTGCIISGSSIGGKGRTNEEVGQEAAKALKANLEHGGCVDEFLQDQIIIFLALAEGSSTVITGPLTLHTETAIWLAEQMTSATFKVTEESASTMRITCQGIGYRPSSC